MDDTHLEILTIAQMREADARTIAAGTSGYDLMVQAGRAVAGVAERMASNRGRVLVLCGPGNNGGDGFVAARLLAECGFTVEVALLGDREALRGDAAQAATSWSGPVITAAIAEPATADLVIDALFGAGLDRGLEGEAAALVERVNACGRPVLSVDVPSGLDGDTGEARGAAVRATRTVTFARRKPGHLLYPGRALCGPVGIAEIGITDATVDSLGVRTRANGPGLWGSAFPCPAEQGHKYGRGHTVVLSGEAVHTGAARLAARAALRAGSGLVTLASPGNALLVNAAQLTAVMLRRCDDPEGLRDLLSDPRFNAVALGPALGVGKRTRDIVAVARTAGRALVLDADALTSFAGEVDAFPPTPMDEADAAASWPVITPHEGEFRRLFEGDEAVLGADSKLERARVAAARLRAVVVLKGPDTVIAAPDGRAAINENGTAYLATAGSGDVLTGIIAGLLAQRMPPFEAAAAGVWLHAEAGSRIGPGLIAEDLPEALPGVLRQLLAQHPGAESR